MFSGGLLADVLGADVVGGEEAQEGSAGGGGFDGGAAVGFFALHDADHGGDDHAGFARGFDGVDGGGAGGADVVDDDDARAFAAEAFDAAAGAVGFFGLADQEAVEQGSAGMLDCARQALAVATLETMGSAPMVSPPTASASMLVCFKQFEDGVAGEAAAFGVQRGGAAVDVVVAGAAGGELELAEAEAGAGEKREQLLGVGGHQCDCNRGLPGRSVESLRFFVKPE